MRSFILLLLAIILLTGCTSEKVQVSLNPVKVIHERTPISSLEPHLSEAVIKGRHVMLDEGLGENGLSCASCHPNPELNNIWASIFPRRWASTVNPEHRIITLAQHNYGAYKDMMGGDLEPEDPRFNYLNIYIMWLGDGTAIWEKRLPGAFQLEESIIRGRDLYYDTDQSPPGLSCFTCHSEESMAGVASVFPRYIKPYGEPMILDTFLQRHALDKQGWRLEMQGPEIAHLSSYLTNLSRGYVISLERR